MNERATRRRTRQASPRGGQLVRDAREHRGLSQGALAEVLGVTAGTVHRWESGSNCPQARHRAAICSELNLDIDEMARCWGVPIIGGQAAPVIPLRPDQVGVSTGRLSDEAREFLGVVLQGLRDGHATSELWTLNAERAASLLGIPWGDGRAESGRLLTE